MNATLSPTSAARRLAACGLASTVAAIALWTAPAVAAEPYDGPIWHVSMDGDDEAGDGSQEAPLRSIAAALAKARASEIIDVGPGTWDEPVTLTQAGLTLQGAGQDATVLVGASGTLVTLSGSGQTVSGLELQSTGTYTLQTTGSSTVRDCRLRGKGAYGGGHFVRVELVQISTGWGINTFNTSATVTDCLFVDVKSCVTMNAAVVTVTGSTFARFDNALWDGHPYNGYFVALGNVFYDGSGEALHASGNNLTSRDNLFFGVYKRGTGPVVDRSGDLDADPRLVDPEAGDYRVACTSPAVGSRSDGSNRGWDKGCVDIATPYRGPIWHVAATGDDTSGDGSDTAPLRSVGAAAARALHGHTVAVGAGTWTEEVVLSQNGLSLYGAGQDATTLVSTSGTLLRLAGTGQTLSGIELQSTGSYSLQTGSASVVTDCRLRGRGAYGGGTFTRVELIQIPTGWGINAFNTSATVTDSLCAEVDSCITLNSATVTVTGSTFARFKNALWDGHPYNGSFTAVGNIFYDGTGEALHAAGNSLTSRDNLFFGVYKNATGPVVDQSGDLDADPQLVDPFGGDYHIACSSPAVGSGPDGANRGWDKGCVDVSTAWGGPDWHVAMTGDDAAGDGSAVAPLRTIAASLDRALASHRVVIGAGRWDEKLTTATNGLRLVGAGQDATVVAWSSGTTVTLTGSGQTVSDLALESTGSLALVTGGGSTLADARVTGRGVYGGGTFTNVAFVGIPTGAALNAFNGSSTVAGCRFVDVATAVTLNAATVNVSHSTFVRFQHGLWDSHPYNGTFVATANVFFAGTGEALHAYGNDLTSSHNLFWDVAQEANDRVIRTEDVTADPQLVNATAGDLRLVCGSPAVASGPEGDNRGWYQGPCVVLDSDPPIVTVEGVADGGLSGAAVAPVVIVTDNSDLASVVVTLDGADMAPGTVVGEGHHALHVAAADIYGNAAEADVAFVVDLTPPLVTCPPDLQVLTDPGTCSATLDDATLGFAASSDAVTEVVNGWRAGVPAGQVFSLGVTSLTWTVVDAVGHQASCVQGVRVVDAEPPSLAMPPDATVECDAVPGAAPPVATDLCDADVALELEESRVDGPNVDTYTLLRTWTATDDAGNLRRLAQRVEVGDTTPPTLVLPADATVECDEVPDAGIAEASDNCATEVVASYAGEGQLDWTCSGEYVLSRTWTAVDNAGNTVSGSQRLAVVDTTPPTLDLPAIAAVVECDGGGNAAALAQWLADRGGASAHDACGDLRWSHDFTGLGAGCGATGQAVVTFTATDACGDNAVSTIASFVIEDTTAPAVTCPDDLVVAAPADACGAEVAFDVPASDTCGEATVQTPSGGSFPVGTTAVEAVAVDACQLAARCAFSVTVEDVQPPTITACPAPVVLWPEEDGLALVPELRGQVLGAADACGVASMVQVPASGALLGEGDHAITIEVTDGSGLSATCQVGARVPRRLTLSPDDVAVAWREVARQGHGHRCGDDDDSDGHGHGHGRGHGDRDERDDGGEDAGGCFRRLTVTGTLELLEPAALAFDLHEPGTGPIAARVVASVAGATLADQTVDLDKGWFDLDKWRFARSKHAPEVGLDEVRVDWTRAAEYDSHEAAELGDAEPRLRTAWIWLDGTRLRVDHKKVAKPFTLTFAAPEGPAWSITVIEGGVVGSSDPGLVAFNTHKHHLELLLPARLAPGMEIGLTRANGAERLIPIDPQRNYRTPEASFEIDLDATALSEELCASGAVTSAATPLLEVRLHLLSGPREAVGDLVVGPDEDDWNKAFTDALWRARFEAPHGCGGHGH